MFSVYTRFLIEYSKDIESLPCEVTFHIKSAYINEIFRGWNSEISLNLSWLSRWEDENYLMRM